MDSNTLIITEAFLSFGQATMNSERESGTTNGNTDRVELKDNSEISHSSAYNADLAPIPISQRYWSAYHFAALWAGMACNIPSYMTASGLIANGMNWWQALLTIFIGNSVVLLPIVLNSHPGTRYGIPFPVLVRASFGIRGSNLPALMRAIVACGWFGINAWIGGQALFTLFKTLIPKWKTFLGEALISGYTATEWVSFLLFWALNIVVIFKGMDFLKKFETLAAPFVFTLTFALTIWMLNQAHGLGSLIESPGKYKTASEFLPAFVPAVTAMIGSWSTLSLNMPDFTRFSKSQKSQILGQVTALPASMTAFAAMGILITSAGTVLYPNMTLTQLWDPVTLVGQLKEPAIVAASMFTIMLATLSVNIAANLVSPANDFANILPRWITFRKGAFITGLLGIAIQPWRLIEDPNAYIFTWLLGYAGGLGSISGVMIADYWIVRKTQLDLRSLYLTEGPYWYQNGWNWRAVAATICGCIIAWIGLLLPQLRVLYDYSWFGGIFSSIAVYVILMNNAPRQSSVSKG